MPGSRAIIAYLLGMLFFAYAFIQRVAPSVMTTELMRDFAVGAGSLGVLSGAYFYTYALLQIPVGLLTDRFGPRKLMSAAIVVCAFASIGFASSTTLMGASFYRAIIGGAVAFGFVGTLAISAQFFQPKRFAMLAGLVQSMGMLGAMAGQAPLRILVEDQGWQHTFIWLAGVAILLGLLIFTLVPRRVHTPESQSSGHGLRRSLIGVVKNRQSWLCAGIGFGMAAPMLSFAGLWAIPWLGVAYELGRAEAATIVSMLFAGWALGSPLAGWLSDRHGKRKPVMISGVLLSLVTLFLLVFTNGLDIRVIVLLFFLNGLGGSAMVVLFGSVRELNNPTDTATSMGLANMCVVGSGAVTQPLLGWILDNTSDGQLHDGLPVFNVVDYRYAVSALLVALALSLICALMLRETRCTNIYAG